MTEIVCGDLKHTLTEQEAFKLEAKIDAILGNLQNTAYASGFTSRGGQPPLLHVYEPPVSKK
jgi:hypothetical protein